MMYLIMCVTFNYNQYENFRAFLAPTNPNETENANFERTHKETQ